MKLKDSGLKGGKGSGELLVDDPQNPRDMFPKINSGLKAGMKQK